MRRVRKGFSGMETPLFSTMVIHDQEEIGTSVCLPSDNVANKDVYKELDDSLVRVATTASSLKAKQDSGGGPRHQETIGDTIAQTRSKRVSKFSNDLMFARINTPQSDEDSLKLNELMELCTKLKNRDIDLENTKTTQALEIDSLKKRVKKLERRKRSRTHGLKRLYKVDLTARVDSFDDEQSLSDEDASKQGRKIDDIDVDEGIILVDEIVENQERFNDEEMFDAGVLDDEELFAKQEGAVKDLTVNEVTLAQALTALKSTKPKAKRIVFREPGKSTTTTTTIPIPSNI
uniref:Uncharacterized protein n=1 Tax=Tanacetum cinerariifolium TaxID=118510 RepID=A0A6L2MVT5_TANCI|nr:hypothetical protein [Tanacetum cinerariifolium]